MEFNWEKDNFRKTTKNGQQRTEVLCGEVDGVKVIGNSFTKIANYSKKDFLDRARKHIKLSDTRERLRDKLKSRSLQPLKNEK